MSKFFAGGGEMMERKTAFRLWNEYRIYGAENEF